jgi:MFS family permease
VLAEPHPRVVAPSSLGVAGVLVLGLGALDFGLEQSLVLPALPALADHYSASLDAAAWLATGFLLASVISIPLLGRLGDLFGKRRLLVASLAAFATGSMICALTGSIELAIAGRTVQGVGAAVGPLSYSLARDTVRPDQLPRAIGGIVGAASAGGAIGFLLSGLLVDHVSANAIFWVLFAMPIILAAGLIVLVPESHVRARAPIDVGGAVLLGAGLAALLLAISKGNAWNWSSGRTLGLFAAAVALLSLFVIVERGAREPLVDLGLVVTRPFADANLCAFAFGYSFFLAVFVVPQIAAAPTPTGYGLGLSATAVGYILIPTGVTSLIGGWVGGRIVDRFGPRALVATGSTLGIAAYASLALAHGSAAALALGSGLLGLSWGLILTGIYSVVVRAASSDKTGVAVAVNVLSRNTAVSVGAQAAFAVIVGAGTARDLPVESGYTRALVMGAAGACFALVASALLPGRVATLET